MNLDDLLDQSAPPVSQRTPALRSELNDLVLTTEAAARPRRFLRTASVSLVAIAALGCGTTAAMASGIIPTPSWIPWVTTSQTNCEMYFVVEAAGLAGEPKTRTYSVAEGEHAARVANDFLASFDYTTIDKAAVIREYQAREDEAIAALPDPAERPPRTTGSELEIAAVGAQVAKELRAHLESQGIPMETVLFMQGWRCER
jgi:hypothetical protein